MLWRAWKFFRHQFNCRYKKGHGIHSPYLFDVVSRIIFNTGRVYCPDWVLEEHRRMKKDPSSAGEEGRTISSFARQASVSEKQGALLYRMVQWFKPEMMVELGTGMGISALYMASAAPGIPLHSIEGNTERAALAAQLVSRCQLGPVSIHWGEMEVRLEEIMPLVPGRFLAFVDGNHHFEPTVDYVRNLVGRAGEEAVIVMDDIYWSRDMYRAWREIISWPEVRVSVDLFHMGILLLRKDLNKREIKIKF